MAKTSKGESIQQYQKKYYLYIGLLKHAFLVTAFRPLKEMCEVSTLSFHTGTAEGIILEPYLFPKLLAGAVYFDFLINVLPELLQDVHLQTRIHAWFFHDAIPTTRSSCSLGNSGATCVRNNGYDRVDQHHDQLVHLMSVPYICISGDTRSLLFMLQDLQQ
jgi:hypothetical protein